MEASDGTRGSGLAGEDVFGCGAPHSRPRLLRLLFPVPRERGGRRCRPARGGGEKRLCRRRQKRRRCESSGLRAPFLCTETESGSEGSRRFAYPSTWYSAVSDPPRFYPERVLKPRLYITCSFSVPFYAGDLLLTQE